jgi:hypothetical protein
VTQRGSTDGTYMLQCEHICENGHDKDPHKVARLSDQHSPLRVETSITDLDRDVETVTTAMTSTSWNCNKKPVRFCDNEVDLVTVIHFPDDSNWQVENETAEWCETTDICLNDQLWTIQVPKCVDIEKAHEKERSCTAIASTSLSLSRRGHIGTMTEILTQIQQKQNNKTAIH